MSHKNHPLPLPHFVCLLVAIKKATKCCDWFCDLVIVRDDRNWPDTSQMPSRCAPRVVILFTGNIGLNIFGFLLFICVFVHLSVFLSNSVSLHIYLSVLLWNMNIAFNFKAVIPPWLHRNDGCYECGVWLHLGKRIFQNVYIEEVATLNWGMSKWLL